MVSIFPALKPTVGNNMYDEVTGCCSPLLGIAWFFFPHSACLWLQRSGQAGEVVGSGPWSDEQTESWSLMRSSYSDNIPTET